MAALALCLLGSMSAPAQLVLDLGPNRVADIFRDVVAGDVSAAELAGFLIALRLKGETPDEDP